MKHRSALRALNMLLSISEHFACPSVVAPNSLDFDRKHRSKSSAYEKMPLSPPGRIAQSILPVFTCVQDCDINYNAPGNRVIV